MPPQMGLLNGFAAGLISLANYVSARMPEVYVEIHDLSACSFDEARNRIVASCVDPRWKRIFVGITTTTASYQSALLVARMVRNIKSRSVIVFGGHHASADPETILRNHSDIIDLIIIGEGERSLCELIRNYPSVEQVPGIASLEKGAFLCTAPPVLLKQDELDSIPITYGDNGFIGTPGKFDHATYVSARGCHLRCAFCMVGNDRIRAKSIPIVAKDIETLLDMGFSRIAIEDNFFAHSPARTKEICEALVDIKRRQNGAFTWDCQTRVESLARKDTINLLAKAGCEAVYIGVESVHPEQLVYLNKTSNSSKYLQMLIEIVVPSLLKTDIDCYLNLQFGVPGETVEHGRKAVEILASLGRLAAKRGKRITVFPQLHVVYPGTAHFRQGIAHGRFLLDVFESFTEWEFKRTPVLFWLGEHFAHGAGGIPEGILRADLLRNGVYEVDIEAVLRISATLRSIDRIPGMRTFNYGDHIVTNADFMNRTDVREVPAKIP